MADSVEHLIDVLDNIQSGRVKDRESGLAELRRVLSLWKKPITEKLVKNKSIHAACETIFQHVSSERSTYVKASTKSTAKASSAKRLESCASTIRAMVDAFVFSMRIKTVQAILGHITQTLPTADGGFCTPLALGFFKALRAILDYQPHVEHLDHDIWSDLVDFCINGLEIYGEDVVSTPVNKRPSREITDNSVELVGCLRSLTIVSNCPLLQKAPEIVRAVAYFIGNSSSTTAAHHAAFETINACLKVISTHSERLMTWALAKILPLIKNLWHKKESTLRDEMLASLVYSKTHLVFLGQKDQSDIFLPVVEGLLETMWAEYLGSRDRGHLHLDHLSLYTRDRPSMQLMPMQCSTFSLRKSTKETEHNWTTLYFVAFFTNWVDAQHASHQNEHPADGMRSPKRRRVTSRLLERTSYAFDMSTPEKLAYNLQVVTFAVEERSLSQTELTSVLDFLVPNAAHENGDVSSWALLSLANCALQLRDSDSAVDSSWLKAWYLANRLISSVPHSRAACHLLDVLLCTTKVKFESVLDSVDALFSSASLNGPALLSDSALSMWLTMLQLRSASNPAQIGDTDYEKLLEWICSKWKPSNFENRSHCYQINRETSTSGLENAFAAIIARRLAYSGDGALTSLGRIGEPWLFQWLHKPLLDYLLLADNKAPQLRITNSNHLDSRIKASSGLQNRVKSGLVILNYFVSEADKLIKTWREIRENQQSTINVDMIEMLFSFCILGTTVSSGIKPSHGDHVSSLQLKLGDLANDIISYCCCNGKEVLKISALLQVISPLLPNLSSNDGIHRLSLVMDPLATILTHFAQTLEFNRGELDGISLGIAMDLDELEFDTEPKDSKNIPLSRRQDSACCNERTFIESSACYIQFLSCLFHETSSNGDSDIIPAVFVRHIMSLGPEDLTSCRPLLKMILSSNFELRVQDVGDLLEHLHGTLLDPYEWNRCEVALGVCMDVMHGTTTLWTDPSLVSVADFGAQLYEWFMETALGNGILSTTSQVTFVDLLYRLLDVDPNYEPNNDEDAPKPSVRTRLFDILKSGNLIVQYHISQHLVNVFNSFVLSQHELIFDDIFESLPNEVGHQEGIYLRMLVFTQIGSTWRSLLRLCLFHILETAGLTPDSAPHAKHCVQKITNALVLPDARCTFRLFSPQLLHTWLELHPLKSIAYTIFGYPDLKTMLQDAKAQFLSQLLMIGSPEKLNEFETELGSEVKNVLSTSFGQAAAYGIAKDLSMHGTGGSNSHAAEARIRDTLGKTQYVEHLKQELPVIVGHLFVRLEQEEHIEKTLAKRAEYAYAANTLKIVKNLSHSTNVFSQSQQPSFKSRILLEEIDRICRRINRNPTEVWTASLVIRVARMLFEDANDAFGPLHACRTIQRLRLLVCLAGSTAITGYPLEMLIHSLRPFITNHQCADDAIGLYRYLMDFGKDHLLQNPRFLGGTSLTLMLSLRNFLNSTQDSTTQGAQHRATLSRAETFREWLAHYMQSYSPKVIQGKSLERLHAMISSAHQIVGPGGASIETPESQLLLHLLDDIKGNYEILGEHFTSACITLLCKDFSGPLSYREDILGTDETAACYAAAIWKTLRIPHASEPYLRWAATALGRGFGYGGYVEPEIMQETSLKDLTRKQRANSLPLESTSKVSIILSVVELLWDDRSEIVGLAEIALQQIVSQYKRSGEDLVIESAVPLGIADSFSSDTYGSSNPKTAVSSALSEVLSKTEKPFKEWIEEFSCAVAASSTGEPVLGAIIPLLAVVEGLAAKLFPFVLHVSLVTASFGGDDSPQRQQLSQAFNECLKIRNENSRPRLESIINSALYLRTQPKPQERTLLDRNDWLDLDMIEMASAAHYCKMSKTALLLTELAQPLGARGQGRQSSVTNISRSHISSGLLVSIFRELEEPDSFYGVEQESDLESIAARLDYEGDNIQSLLLRGAKMDSQLRENKMDHLEHAAAIIQSLGKLGLNSVTNSLASTQRRLTLSSTVMDSMISSALKLGQWDIATPSANITTEGLVYRTFQSFHNFQGPKSARQATNEGLFELLKGMEIVSWTGSTIVSSFRALSALTEVNDLLDTRGIDQFFETWQKFLNRDVWMAGSRPDNVSLLLTSRETLCGILGRETGLQESLHLSARSSRLIEASVGLHASKIYRKVGSLQESLSTVTYLSSLIEPSTNMFQLKFDASVKKETADILWQRRELGTSIKTLQDINETSDFETHAVPVGKAGLLADIAHRVSYARLEKPDDIMSNYLKPALKHLKQVRQGPEAGKVFHEYATYCHKQLENPDSVEELRRSERFKRQRLVEVRDLEIALTAIKNDKENKKFAQKELENAERWLKLDEQENQRLREAREQFLKSSLEHYLRSLAACDEFDTNVIRFLAIWLGNAEDDTANKPVRDFQSRVPSKKFTLLMNQLSSRLQETENEFQLILGHIIMRICQDHPYHGMYHIFAGSKTSGGNDSQARSRNGAANKIAKKLENNPSTGPIWTSIHSSNELYNTLANLRAGETKQGTRLHMKQFNASKVVARDVPNLKVPPITMAISINDDLNYNEVPTVVAFRPDIAIASGVSAPKIITAVASNGIRYRQLFKGGTDDLRQDAIMEQVFEQVTSLLKTNKATRQRGLRVRTYKVVPLDAKSGAIEFVEPTMSLNDYLLDAHVKYNPKDLKWKACRDKMGNAAELDLSARLKEFQNIKSRFSPVLRNFFFERFENPDAWFDRRLAYTRSTAAISVLGYVLGLGDRHCQNILLDTQTGEVVHIDLGVAFEAGRILPKPETVPFRLTRDIIDGFGILKTEGVFRRCCEFTLEALRLNKDTILTLLNVLRYDPLYHWTVSPLRAKRLQDEQHSRIAEAKAGSVVPSRAISRRSSAAAQDGTSEEAELLKEKRREDEGGEADRALSTVDKKLAAGLSVSATVNELIQQATDDKNLAVLFHGWAPFA